MLKKTFIISSMAAFMGQVSFSEETLPEDKNFKVETISEKLEDPMEIAVSKNGHIFVIERKGKVKLYSPETNETTTIAELEVASRPSSKSPASREGGLLGIALDPDFEKNGWVYLYYSLKKRDLHRLSRFTFKRNKLSREKKMLEVPQFRGENVCHEAGAIEFGPDGLLYLSTGDNTNPFVSNGYAPIDEQKGREWADAQRTAANTNDLRGKILRIKPTAKGGYTIPDGNLFRKGTARTRPEIYIMGCRNPYRMSIDPKTNYLYWGKVGPDAAKNSDRGPRGYDEINQAREAGNFGWPYFSAKNEAYADYDFKSKEVGEHFVASNPINESVNNTGLKKLPPAQPAFHPVKRSCAGVGPVYYDDLYPDSATKFPKTLDSTLFTYDWNKGKIQLIKLDEKGNKKWVKPILKQSQFHHLSDIELGSQGELYVLEYGTAWYGGKNGKIRRITYSAEDLLVDNQKVDPRMAGLPLDHPGSKMIGESTCLACHMTNQASIGPKFIDIANKYSDKKDRESYLANKILKGSVGVWGEQPMPANAQHDIEEALQIAEAILQTKSTTHDE